MEDHSTVVPLAIAALTLLLCGPSAAGEEPAHDAAAADEHTDSAHHEHFNEIAILLAGTYEADHKETYLTWGLEYQRMFNPRLGLALVGEHINEIDALVFVAPFMYRPVPALRLQTGPGLEILPRRPAEGQGHDDETHGPTPTTGQAGDKSLFLWRFGVGYSVHLGKVVVTPAIDFDLVREHGHWAKAFVFGVAVGVPF